MAKAITERHEIVVESDESVFVFSADSRDGRLVIQQRKKGTGGTSREVCAISLANASELQDFFDGLRRVLSSTGLRPTAPGDAERTTASRPSRARPALPEGGQPPAPSADDRDELVARARAKNAKAFEPWTAREEEDVRRRFEAGEALEDIARAHNRSPKAIQMRLDRLGVTSRS